MFCLYGLKIQKLQGIIELLGKNYIKNKTGFYATSICAMFWKAIYIYYARFRFRFRFRREIDNQLPSLERFLVTISSI